MGKSISHWFQLEKSSIMEFKYHLVVFYQGWEMIISYIYLFIFLSWVICMAVYIEIN